MKKKSKRYRAAQETADLKNRYPLNEALQLLNRMPKAGFDETVELSVKLGVDPRQSTQMVRGVVNLPNGSGKKIRVAVFTDNPQAALEAGADAAGLDDLIQKVQDGWLEFDAAVATPKAMGQVRKVARILGPRGLMPNPKSGTVTEDPAATVKEIQMGGRVEFKMDKTANLGIVAGKRSFSTEQLAGNIQAILETLGRSRPASLKGRYIEGMAVSSTMSPGIKLAPEVYAKI